MANKIREKAGNIPLYLFYIGLTIELLIVLYDRSAIPPLPSEGHVFRITFALFALKVCFSEYTKKEWLWLILAGVFTAAMYFITGENVALRAVVFVAAIRGVEIKPMLKYTFWLTLSGSLLIVLLSFFNIGRGITNEAIINGELYTSYSFGMGHHNTFHCMVLMLILLFLYCYHEKLKLWALTLLFAANIGLYLLTQSEAGFLACALAIAMAILIKLWPKFGRANWIYIAGMLIFLFCIGFSIWAAYIAESWNLWNDTSWLYYFDQLLTNRIRNIYWDSPLNSAAIANWTLFSEAVHFDRIFDMGWVRMFFWFGIIPGTLFAVIHLFLINECRRQKDYMALILIVVIAVYTIIEAQFISRYLGRNYLLLLFGIYWSQMFQSQKLSSSGTQKV